MALFGSLWGKCILFCLILQLNNSLADDETAANTVIEKDPIGVCMWPTPESAVMSCDSGSVVVISETYMTRLVGRTDKCPIWHMQNRPEYAACRLPIPASLAQQLEENCNYTKQCTLGSFITGSVVVTGSTTCGNGSDTALERNFLVIKWGCVGYVAPTMPEFDDTNIDSTGIDIRLNSTDIDIPVGDPSSFTTVWIWPSFPLVSGGVLTVVLIRRRDLIKKKARELRRLRREQRRQAKLQLAAASGGQLPPSDAPDGGTAVAVSRGGAAVASWIEQAPSYSAVAGVSGSLTSGFDRTSTVASSVVLPPAYVHASAVVIDEQPKRSEHRRHQHRRREDSDQLAISSSSVSADGATTSSRRHHRSSGDRSRSHDRSTSSGKKSRSGGGRRSRSRHDGTQSEMSDADLDRRRRRREHLYNGAVHQIRKPDELSPSSGPPSAEDERRPEVTTTSGGGSGGSEAEQTVADVPTAVLTRRSST